MGESETFGVESEYANEVIKWINDQAKKKKLKFEARKYDYKINTQNFGEFEMFSWMGEVKVAREFIKKASKRFKVKIIEGGYKPKEKTYTLKKIDYAIVRKGERIIGHLEFESSRFGSSNWKLVAEERK